MAIEEHTTNGGAFWRWLSLGLIVASLIVITLESVPEIRNGREWLFRTVETAFIGVFAVEYAIRTILGRPPWRYVVSFWGIIDLLAWLPALLFNSPTLVVLRAMRILRVFKLLQLPAFDRATRRLRLAMHATREALVLFGVMGGILIYLSAVGIYFFEHAAQPDVFKSIPHAMWWAVATLTTVGYGDIYPVTLGGRVFTSAILFIGLGIIAVPTGIVTSALLAADEELAIKDRKTNLGDEET